MPQTVDLEIHPLTPDRFDDLAALFQEGGDPKWCWCTFYRFRELDFGNATAATNRAALESLADHVPAPGLVAYLDGRVVGWVSLGPRETFDRLTSSKVLAPIDDRPVWSIICFVVSRRARGKGIAHALLNAAIAYAREHGATILEAYPAETDGDRLPSAKVFKGTTGMFEAAGFTEVARRQANATTRPRPIVRLHLTEPS